MYVRINLLPPEIKARWESERKKRTALLMAGAVLAIFIVLYGVLVLATFQVRADVTGLRNERAELESKIPALQQYAQLQNQIEQTEGLIKEAVGIPPSWKSVLENIGLHIPVNVWLSDLSYSNEKNGGRQSTSSNSNTTNNQEAPETCGELTIQGYAFEYIAMTQWLEQIRQIPELTGVNCRFSSREELNGEPVIRFEIKAGVLSGQPAG
ncbi:hypothetical protein SPSYN_00297 [Sporotomaculum syntrophicum]|uniref:Fimbrial assembly protein (PilN) n=1 Tax=Sporotomaculum syntrophicum TaxID=182264 RepID=A0A9D3B052_9FIRM|nr:PilN domain-containing protein [Sporotomaculum syntrophicum]KAF1086578.1 hypothetical protein SPSYN_00297 [Sporotomaculum syntrophicum]